MKCYLAGLFPGDATVAMNGSAAGEGRPLAHRLALADAVRDFRFSASQPVDRSAAAQRGAGRR
jgi:hypothetical protein